MPKFSKRFGEPCLGRTARTQPPELRTLANTQHRPVSSAPNPLERLFGSTVRVRVLLPVPSDEGRVTFPSRKP
jgi:hypothetical protein